MRILYAGCGIGLRAIEIAKKDVSCSHVIGLDPSLSLVEMAKKNKESKSVDNIEFVQASISTYKPDCDPFDIIIVGSGERLPLHREQVFAAAFDLLATDGSVIGWDLLSDDKKSHKDQDSLFYLNLITEHEYSSLVEHIGYSNVRLEEINELSDRGSAAALKITSIPSESLQEVIITASKPSRR